jgi:hypothetical protein
VTEADREPALSDDAVTERHVMPPDVLGVHSDPGAIVYQPRHDQPDRDGASGMHQQLVDRPQHRADHGVGALASRRGPAEEIHDPVVRVQDRALHRCTADVERDHRAAARSSVHDANR